MAIIYSYPLNNNILPTDIIVSTSTAMVAGKPKNQTKSIEILNLATFINTSSSNNLNQVLVNGNTSLLSAKIGDLGLYDPAEQDYGTLDLSDSEFRFWDTSGVATILSRNGITILGNSTSYGSILLPTYTTSHLYSLPDKTGVIALTSDIPSVVGYVPYSGATNNVDLGMQYITSREYRFLDTLDNTYGRLFVEAAEFTFMATPTSVIARINYGQLTLQGIDAFNATINYNTLTNNRVYALPDASGTIALTSNIPVVTGFVPYTGATQAVNLGAYNLTVNSVSVGKGSGTGAGNTAVGNLALSSNTTGNYNSAFGSSALTSNLSGNYNVGIGYISLFANTSGNFNTSVGHQSLRTNTTGTVNVAIGANSMFSNIDGNYNTAVGVTALQANTSANFNSAFGHSALYSNTTGASNTCIGQGALYTNTTGSSNTAIGKNSLYQNTLGGSNVAIGLNALFSSVSTSNIVAVGWSAGEAHVATLGSGSVYVGYVAGRANTSGYNNTYIGAGAGQLGTTGNYNTALGETCLQQNTTGINNTALGARALSSNTIGSNNISIGAFAGNAAANASPNTSGNQSIFIGANTRPLNVNDSNQIVIGNSVFGAGSNTVTIGDTNIVTTRLRGAVQGGSFVKDGGTSSQYLMADGSVTNGAYRYNFAGSLTLTGTLTTTNLLTITIPANSLSDYIDIRSIMFQHSGTVLAGVQIKVWKNSVNNFATATQIANYSFGAGANLYGQMARSFSLQSGLLIGFPQTPSSATGTASSSTTMLSTAFDTTIGNYLFISAQLNDITDTVTLRNVNITN